MGLSGNPGRSGDTMPARLQHFAASGCVPPPLATRGGDQAALRAKIKARPKTASRATRTRGLPRVRQQDRYSGVGPREGQRVHRDGGHEETQADQNDHEDDCQGPSVACPSVAPPTHRKASARTPWTSRPPAPPSDGPAPPPGGPAPSSALGHALRAWTAPPRWFAAAPAVPP